MWEKIVLNLLSNALKFTLQGAIQVCVQDTGDDVALMVRDTGVGIPEQELPNLFTRFHRISQSRARTHEGSGIGLALVQELVKLHGGSIHVESAVDRGTEFTVSIPKGSAHLPKERVSVSRTLSSTALGAAPFVEEALRWLPDDVAELENSRSRFAVASKSKQLWTAKRRWLQLVHNRRIWCSAM
jgi:hypothetical protein